jgi:hypothetical protein
MLGRSPGFSVEALALERAGKVAAEIANGLGVCARRREHERMVSVWKAVGEANFHECRSLGKQDVRPRL